MGELVRSLPAASMIGAGLALLLGVIHAARLPHHFRPDVPRWRRETYNRSNSVPGFWFGDLYTPEGNRCRRRMIMYGAIGLALFAVAMPLLDAPSHVLLSIPPLVAIGVLLVLAVAIGSDVAHLVPRRGAGDVLYESDAHGRLRGFEEVPAAPEEYGPQYREICPCCGYPTIHPQDPYRLCNRCDWEEPDSDAGRDATSSDRERLLREARARFKRNLTVYDFTHPEPWMRVFSDTERQLKQAMIDEFERMKREGGWIRFSGWQRIFALESQLAEEQSRNADAAVADEPATDHAADADASGAEEREENSESSGMTA